MAFSRFCGNGSSLSARLNLLVFITIVIVYCSSASPIFDLDSSNADIDDEMSAYPSSYRLIELPQSAFYPSRDPFRNLVRKSLAIEPIYRSEAPGGKRYASQAFHAMRG